MDRSHRNARRWTWAALVLALVACALGGLPHTARASCGSAVCSINTDWNVHGVWTEPGARVDLRYELIVQDQPRHGTAAVNVGAGGGDHAEVRTVNRNVVASLDYALSPQWGLSFSLPYVQREHTHIEDFSGAHTPEHWNFAEPGDVRVLARVQTALEPVPGPQAVWGALGGLKLPSGRTDVKNPEGERAERTLQPGTGTTDALLGGFYQYILPNVGALFAQLLLQNALTEADRFRPGNKAYLDAGFRYNATPTLGLLIQVNAQERAKDSGAQAEPEDSGGRAVYLSPGLSYTLGHDVQLYGFYQWAAYQFVNGTQLTASSATVVGGSLRF